MIKQRLIESAIILAVILGIMLVFPWRLINWGTISLQQAGTITVTGQAKQDQSPQIAHFSAAVSASNDDKDVATNEVNTKMDELIKAVKNFGIPDEDIQTQNISVYESQQVEILIYPPPPRQPGWTASNSVSITLRDIDKAGELSDLLNTTGATSINGPNFSIDDTKDSDAQLLKLAVEDAKKKAQETAKASGRKLGRVITVTESGTSYPPLYRSLEVSVDSSAPTPVEPGTETVYKTVTVVFELK